MNWGRDGRVSVLPEPKVDISEAPARSRSRICQRRNSRYSWSSSNRGLLLGGLLPSGEALAMIPGYERPETTAWERIRASGPGRPRRRRERCVRSEATAPLGAIVTLAMPGESSSAATRDQLDPDFSLLCFPELAWRIRRSNKPVHELNQEQPTWGEPRWGHAWAVSC